MYTVSSPGENATFYASSSSTCHKQQPILYPVLHADKGGGVYSSKFLLLQGENQGPLELVLPISMQVCR